MARRNGQSAARKQRRILLGYQKDLSRFPNESKHKAFGKGKKYRQQIITHTKNKESIYVPLSKPKVIVHLNPPKVVGLGLFENHLNKKDTDD